MWHSAGGRFPYQYEELLWDSLADAQDATSRQRPIHENDNEPVGFKGSGKTCTSALMPGKAILGIPAIPSKPPSFFPTAMAAEAVGASAERAWKEN